MTMHEAFDQWVAQAFTPAGREKRRGLRGSFQTGWLDHRMGQSDFGRRRQMSGDARSAYMAGRQSSVLAKKSETKD